MRGANLPKISKIAHIRIHLHDRQGKTGHTSKLRLDIHGSLLLLEHLVFGDGSDRTDSIREDLRKNEEDRSSLNRTQIVMILQFEK